MGRDALIKLAEEAGDFVIGDDGFVVWWPDNNTGAHSKWSLRALADYLEGSNAEWSAQIERELGRLMQEQLLA